MCSDCKASQKREERFYNKNEAVKNIVTVIWGNLETHRQVSGRGGLYCTGQLVWSGGRDNRPRPSKSEYTAEKLPLKVW